MPRIALCCAVMVALCPASLLLARTQGLSGGSVCDQAAFHASRATGVPVAVLRALTRAETGRAGSGEPWPWTVNQAGKGYWFDSEGEARQFVEAQLQLGYTNLDVGCFQLNHRWHGQAFPSLNAMFDPAANARYAAAYIAQKYRNTGDWVAAAGAYHSGTPEYAGRYSARFSEILGRMEGDVSMHYARTADPGAPPAAPRVNNYPLLLAGDPGSAGSVVPRTSGLGSLFSRSP